MKKIFASVAIAVAMVVVFAQGASASVATLSEAVAPRVAFTIDAAAVAQLLLAVVLPLLVGIVTTRVTSAAAKSWLLAALTLTTSMTVELARSLSDGTTYDIGVGLLTAIPAFTISVAMHYGVWKPSEISGKLQDFGSSK